MERMTITFYEEVYQKLKNRSEKRGQIPIAQSVRELLDIGFRVEEASEKNEENGNGSDLMESLSDIKNLLKNNLNWSLETRLLQRLLIEKNPHLDEEESKKILAEFKEAAVNHVDELIEKKKK